MKRTRNQALCVAVAALLLCLCAPFAALAEGEDPPAPAISIGLATQDKNDPQDLNQYYRYTSPLLGNPKDHLELWVPLICTGGDAANVTCTLTTDLSGTLISAGTVTPASAATVADGAKVYFCLPLTLGSAGTLTTDLSFRIAYDGGESAVTLPGVKVTVEPASTAAPDASASDDTDYGISYDTSRSSGTGSSFKSKPKVIVSGYTFDAEKLYAGESFTMTLKLRNTSEREAVKNLQVNFSNEAGVVLPVSGGSNSIFIGDLFKDAAVSMNIGLQIAPDAEPKSQMLALEITYEGTKNKQEFTEKSNIAVPILQKTRVRTDAPVFYDEAYAGQSCSMSVQMFNMGKSSLYNCMVSIEGEGLSLEETYYAGNIASGGTMRADVTLLTQTAGEIEGAVLITYEDVYGDQSVERLPFTLLVNEAGSIDAAMGADGGMAFATGGNAAMSAMAQSGANGGSGGLAWYWFLLIAAVLAAATVLLLLLGKRRRARMLEEALSMDADDPDATGNAGEASGDGEETQTDDAKALPNFKAEEP